jgi:hypothetical protein
MVRGGPRVELGDHHVGGDVEREPAGVQRNRQQHAVATRRCVVATCRCNASTRRCVTAWQTLTNAHAHANTNTRTHAAHPSSSARSLCHASTHGVGSDTCAPTASSTHVLSKDLGTQTAVLWVLAQGANELGYSGYLDRGTPGTHMGLTSASHVPSWRFVSPHSTCPRTVRTAPASRGADVATSVPAQMWPPPARCGVYISLSISLFIYLSIYLHI